MVKGRGFGRERVLPVERTRREKGRGFERERMLLVERTRRERERERPRSDR